MARVKVEPGGKVLVAVLIVGALLLLFLKVRASINEGRVAVKPFQPAPIRVQPNNVVDSAGARAVEEKRLITTQLTLEPVKIFFDFNRAIINKNVYCIFDRIERSVKEGRQDLRIMIEGNADSIGPSWYNEDLSRRRAERVADSLSKRLGIPFERIEIVANGSGKPIASNGTREGRAENRRTEIHVFR